MGYLKRRWIWLKRFRHRKGYGVHSPFAFNFLTGVVYEKGEYYAYHELDALYGQKNKCGTNHKMKCLKFLFRLANYVHPKSICIYGSVKPDVAAYLSSGCHSAVVAYEKPIKTEEMSDKLIYISDDVAYSQWSEIVTQPMSVWSVAVICGIHGSRQAGWAWEQVKMLPQVGVTFDLYDYGILFYDLKKQKQHYIVNFN